jgi:hypothetical protein
MYGSACARIENEIEYPC